MSPLTSSPATPLLALLACSIALAAPLRAAVISWSGATGTPVSGDADVSTSGTLKYAYNFGAPGVASTTVNGVTFTAFSIPDTYLTWVSTVTVGSVKLTEQPGTLWSFNTHGASSGNFTSLSTGYKALLSSGASASYAATITVELSGLTSGKSYLLQWWASNTAQIQGDSGENFNSVTATSGSNTTTLSAQTALGQFITGTFTANAPTQTFALDAPGGIPLNSPLINALQLRDITPTGVPDTASTLPIVGLSLIGAMALNRRRSARVRA